MKTSAKQAYARAHAAIRQARQFKQSGCPNLFFGAMADARWYRDHARALAFQGRI